MLQEKTDQICEMASVMQRSIQIDEDWAAKDQEVRSRLVTENKVTAGDGICFRQFGKKCFFFVFRA